MNANPSPRARRVVVKARYVVAKQAGRRSLSTHLRYITREGASRDGSPSQAYGAETDSADVEAFAERSAADRHHFRFIVAPDDGVDLDDLRGFTRELMRRMERDLGTRLEWVAVDHWDTGNPHSHVLVRGKDQKGENLVIGREYIAHGMRIRASEIATEWLGPRTDREIEASPRRDVEQERFTGLDRQLLGRSRDRVVDLAVDSTDVEAVRRRALLLGRLQRLQAMGLARQSAGTWELREDTETVLRQLGERGDIIRTMQRAYGSRRREFAIGVEPLDTPVTGRIVGKGLADELQDKPYLVVDGLDGRGHYVVLPAATDLATLPLGGIVEVRSAAHHVADRNVAKVARDGFYRPDEHLRQLAPGPAGEARAQDIVNGHVRRLEALRRAGIVERLSEGLWRVPVDLVQRGEGYDHARLGNASVELRSHLPIEQQVRAVGATWLDEQLLSRGSASPGAGGFAAGTQEAMRKRLEFLIERGLAERRDRHTFVSRDLLNTLRQREVKAIADKISRETGLAYRPLVDTAPVSGTYRRSIMLASGRFAMLDNGLGFTLVPWRPLLEKALGRSVTAVMRSGHVSWELGRQRGIAI